MSAARVREVLEEAIRIRRDLAAQADAIARAAQIVRASLKAGGTLYLCGNGGSAADCQHIAAELVGRYRQERPAMRAVSLTTDTSALTAIGNDYGYDRVFERQVEAHVEKGDVLMALSTSGNSESVLRAAALAKKRGASVIGLSGRTGGKLKSLCDLCLCVPADTSDRIQECHITIGHVICELVETGQA